MSLAPWLLCKQIETYLAWRPIQIIAYASRMIHTFRCTHTGQGGRSDTRNFAHGESTSPKPKMRDTRISPLSSFSKVDKLPALIGEFTVEPSTWPVSNLFRTRMHSSRMRIVHSSDRLGEGVSTGGISAQGGCLLRGEVSA